jgi:hypothetical protein
LLLLCCLEGKLQLVFSQLSLITLTRYRPFEEIFHHSLSIVALHLYMIHFHRRTSTDALPLTHFHVFEILHCKHFTLLEVTVIYYDEKNRFDFEHYILRHLIHNSQLHSLHTGHFHWRRLCELICTLKFVNFIR